MIGAKSKFDRPEAEPSAPQVGDLVQGWDNASQKEVRGELIENVRGNGNSATGKIRLADGREVEIFFPKKFTEEDPADQKTDEAAAESLPVSKPSLIEASKTDSEALISAWTARAFEIKRNQSSMLSELLAEKKISTEQFT